MRRRGRKIRLNKTLILIIALIGFIIILGRFLTFKNVMLEPTTAAGLTRLEQISYFFHRQGLARKIFNLQPQFIKISFKPNYFTSTLTIKLNEEKIVARLCDHQCYFLGEHSYIFQTPSSKLQAPNDYFPLISRLKLYNNSVLEPKIASALSKVFEFSNLKSLPLQQGEILTNKDLKITTQDGWYFLFDPSQDTEKQIKKLGYFLDNKKETFSTLQYLDLRIPQKIYYHQ